MLYSGKAKTAATFWWEMSNRRLYSVVYSEVVSGQSGESSGEKFAKGQSRQPRSNVCHWLLAYQTDREDVTLEKALELSKVILFREVIKLVLLY